MKNLILTILSIFWINPYAIAQSDTANLPEAKLSTFWMNVYGVSQPDTANLPEANKKVLYYAISQLGKKVQPGYCFNLIDLSLKKVDQKWRNRSNRKYVYGHKIKRSQLIPGDIIYYAWKYEAQHGTHICIVYSVDGEQLHVIEQNTQGSLKKSRVGINIMGFEGLELNKIKYYRPY